MRAITSVILCSLLVLGGCSREEEQTPTGTSMEESGTSPGVAMPEQRDQPMSDQGAMETPEPMDEPGTAMEPTTDPSEEPAPIDR